MFGASDGVAGMTSVQNSEGENICYPRILNPAKGLCIWASGRYSQAHKNLENSAFLSP